MEPEYTRREGHKWAFTFSRSEKKDISIALKAYIPKINKKIKALENHPKNEGQVTYSSKIHDLENMRQNFLDIINEFNQ